ncbi:hypothetical protein [Streptomyces solincola]|uniref:hypothetical protein n=1 Tax=Streptomyces solincola TaxID=2100817 RepID=UPI002AFF0530|nr:hypothetical protein [Streptomyces solincola]
MDLRFSDGVIVDAELRTGETDGPLLAVPAHTTAAGTAVAARIWTVRDSRHLNEGEVELRIGGRRMS